MIPLHLNVWAHCRQYGECAPQVAASRAPCFTRNRENKKRHELPPSHPKGTAYEMVSLQVRYAITNHIVVWSTGWAVFSVLERAIGAVGGLIMVGEVVKVVAES